MTNVRYNRILMSNLYQQLNIIMKRTLARGARQLVVQLALETMLMSDLYSFSLTPTTNMGASLLGAEMTTFLAPPCKHKHRNH
jgi:hypothetical protein